MATADTGHNRDMDPSQTSRSVGSRSASVVRWSSDTNIAAGLWLLAAPFVLGYSAVGAAVSNAIIVGLVVLGLAWYRTANPARALSASWTNAVLGGWLIVAPFVLGYSATAAAVTNDIIVGLVVLTLGAVSAIAGNKLSAGH